MKHVLSALVYLSDKGIIHRDIKPDNILYKGKYTFALADFGLSKIENPTCTPVGSLKYKAPEVNYKKKQTVKADIYSFGAVLLWAMDKLPNLPITNDEKWYVNWHKQLYEIGCRTKPELKSMLERDAGERFSAGACLLFFFGGQTSAAAGPKPPPKNLVNLLRGQERNRCNT